MTGALLLAGPGEARWAAGVGEILRGLGFTIRTVAQAPAATPDIGLVLAGPGDASALPAWHAAGAICAVVLPADAPAPAAQWEPAIVCLREPVTEGAILEMLANHHYLALSAREAAGIPAALAEQTLGDPEFAAGLVRALVTSTEADLAQLRTAGSELETLRSVAHRLKSSAHYVGCQSLRALAQRLEHAARDGDAATTAALAAIFAPTVVRLLALLAALPAKK
ncbi:MULTISPECIES: Hpt domain-containing protein [Cupriavidus]|uniref:Hpt domain-containing protein n=1 Tax=Cupriavidus sp. DF5525 TaxID=3160989 RepID=UPI0003B0878F|nr:hypothetical protein N234_26470 [Ralstonia pickettii DTP0602]